MVSFTQRHLAIMTIEVTMLDDEAPVVISSQTLNRQDGRTSTTSGPRAMGAGVDPRKAEAFEARVLEPQTHWCAGQPDHPRLPLRQLQDDPGGRRRPSASTPTTTTPIFTSADEDTGKMVYRVQAKPGQPIKVTKAVAYHTSRGVPVRELVDRCRRTLDRVVRARLEAEFAAQRQWLDAFWERSDVVVHGQPALQQAIRWNLYQVAQAAARAEQSGVPAKGVTGSGYGGHYFWDTEIYRAAVPHLHLAADGPQRAALPLQHARRGAPAGRGPRPERRAVPVADGQRRGGLGLLRGRHGAVPHRRRHRVRVVQVRRGQRRRGFHAPRGRRHPGRDRPDVGRPRLLAGERRQRTAASTSTASPGPTSTPRSSTTTCSPT